MTYHKSFYALYKQIEGEIESELSAPEEEAPAVLHDDQLELCLATNKRFTTDACVHYLRECYLCGEVSFCVQHGCRACLLKAKDDAASMSAMPDEERAMMLTITEREAAPKKRAAKKSKRVKKWQKTDYLDDILAQNKRS